MNNKLYGINGSCSLAVHIVLDILKIKYQYMDLKESKNELKKILPLAKAPTLVYEGDVFTESSALLIFLSDLFKDSGLFPQEDLKLRARGMEFLSYLSTSMYTNFVNLFRPDKCTDEVQSFQFIKDRATRDIKESMIYLDNIYEDKVYYLNDKLTICDIYFLVFIIWGRNVTKHYAELPNIRRLAARLIENKLILTTLKNENININFKTEAFNEKVL